MPDLRRKLVNTAIMIDGHRLLLWLEWGRRRNRLAWNDPELGRKRHDV
jgi:hypothetical protein